MDRRWDTILGSASSGATDITILRQHDNITQLPDLPDIPEGKMVSRRRVFDLHDRGLIVDMSAEDWESNPAILQSDLSEVPKDMVEEIILSNATAEPGPVAAAQIPVPEEHDADMDQSMETQGDPGPRAPATIGDLAPI